MYLFRQEKHNYWARHIGSLWDVATDDTNHPVSLAVADQYARDFLLFVQSLRQNAGVLLYAPDVDHIPISVQDMQAARLLLNQLFQVRGLSDSLEVVGGGIIYRV